MAPAVTEAPIVDPASTPRFQGFTNSLSEESEKVDGFETPVLPSTRRAHGSRKQKSKKEVPMPDLVSSKGEDDEEDEDALSEVNCFRLGDYI